MPPSARDDRLGRDAHAAVVGDARARAAPARAAPVLAFEQLAVDVEDAGRGVVGEDEIVQLRAFPAFSVPERRVFDLDFAGEDLRRRCAPRC